MTRWVGLYLAEMCHENGYVQIRNINEECIPLLANDYRLKLYRIPLSKEEFINLGRKYLNVIGSFITSSPQHSQKFEKKKGLDENLYEASEANSRIENLSEVAQEKKKKNKDRQVKTSSKAPTTDMLVENILRGSLFI